MEERLLIDVRDLEAIRFQCGGCGAVVIIPTDIWARPLLQCPNCGMRWPYDTPNVHELYQTLSHTLRGIRALAAQQPEKHQISFEVRRRPTEKPAPGGTTS